MGSAHQQSPVSLAAGCDLKSVNGSTTEIDAVLVRKRARDNARAREWRAKNPGAAAKAQARFRARHPGTTGSNATKAAYKARKHKAIPLWANLETISLIYETAKYTTLLTGIEHHVDHVIPLKGRFVCGLHVENNLRIVSAGVNLRKHNKFLEY